MTSSEADLARKILELCALRGPGKTICPSEVARAIASDETTWRAMMPKVREVAATLVRKHRIVAFQKGVSVDPKSAGGTIRLGLPEN
ncbi:MAG: DUF3253 domain-containing protein [Pseudomonadota bacterium]